MYRLRVVPIFLPPLRERRRDITLLLWHFIDRHNALGGRHITRIAPEAMRRLLDHSWPGNGRELQNVVEYAFAVGREEVLGVDDLPPEFREAQPLAPAFQNPRTSQHREGEKARMEQALAAAHGHVGEATELLGVSRATFWRRRKKHEL